ncbi:hypothetical protein TSUD_159110 [Trifolium subterraneum]|uniref:Uncharacterized protein n=1 Tax=Trifolium subterraneum TaxID=3900 RepID=A0A2Z6P6U6_TRISU|nr:hypothetical protein TSUD_159110 [Trifolium subterraneum]
MTLRCGCSLLFSDLFVLFADKLRLTKDLVDPLSVQVVDSHLARRSEFSLPVKLLFPIFNLISSLANLHNPAFLFTDNCSDLLADDFLAVNLFCQ